MSMTRTLMSMKANAPDIYWKAVDMASAGDDPAAIIATVLTLITKENEKRSRQGKRTLEVSYS